MTQITQLGEAEIDSWIRVVRHAGGVEFYHVVDGANIPVTADEYFAGTQEKS